MNLKFSGTYAELKSKLSELGGEWDDSQSGKKILRKGRGLLNWFETGTITFQGKEPEKHELEKSVPHLLYPAEYAKPDIPAPTATVEQTTPTVTLAAKIAKTKENAPAEDNIPNLFLESRFTESILVIGVVYAIGTEHKSIIETIGERLGGFHYKVVNIRVSELMPQFVHDPTTLKGTYEYDRIKHYMHHGDNLRRTSGDSAILAGGVANYIMQHQSTSGARRKTAFIINSLKHPDEVDLLRKVYSDAFYLIGIHADEKRRMKYLMSDKFISEPNAKELVKTDEDESLKYGQKTRDTFHLSDFFINADGAPAKTKEILQRFLDLLFGNPYRNPTFDEFAMFMAFNASIRSSDLSRQVGAIIARNRQIIATGANDCPQHGGGQYWTEIDPITGIATDAPDGKDHMREVDSNKAAQSEIIEEIRNSLLSAKIIPAEASDSVSEILRSSKISDLTEFGRVVHAEMEAIMSCARVGISSVKATLYCTTFPCHNCAKHIVDAGISRVVYVEPYPKSRALEHHSESIDLKVDAEKKSAEDRVTFEPFTGIGARRFMDLFSMSLGAGKKIKRKDKDGKIIEWDISTASMRTPLLPKSYLEIETAASAIWAKATEKTRGTEPATNTVA